LGKASFINGSQFVITWISPKGEVDVYASELLQSSVSAKEGGVLDRKEIEREAVRVRGEMGRRWEDIRRLEEKGEAPVLEDADEPEAVEVDEDDDANLDEDADRTLVDEPWESLQSTKSMPSSSASSSLAKTPAATMMSTFPTATRSSTPASPMHTLKLSPWGLDSYYESKFAALQQATCKLVVKAWIKVIEPKKQMKYPYNKGEELKPAWWPEGVRHREPDHLSKSGEYWCMTKCSELMACRTVDPAHEHRPKSAGDCLEIGALDSRSRRFHLAPTTRHLERSLPRGQGGGEAGKGGR
jgi:hypothetical protein